MAGPLRRLLDGGRAAEHDQIGERDLFSIGAAGVELAVDLFKRSEAPREPGRIIDRPVFLGREANAGPVGTAPLVAPTKRRGRGPGGRDEIGDRELRREHDPFEFGHVLRGDQRVINRRHGILPELRRRDIGPEEP